MKVNLNDAVRKRVAMTLLVANAMGRGLWKPLPIRLLALVLLLPIVVAVALVRAGGLK